MIKRSFALFILLIGACFASMRCSAVETPKSVNEALKSLQSALAIQKDVIADKQARLDSIYANPPKDSRKRLAHFESLGDLYNSFQTDSSAHAYIRGRSLAEALGDTAAFQRMHAKLCSLYPVHGVIINAEKSFDSIPLTQVHPEALVAYLKAGNNMFFTLATSYIELNEQRRFARKAAEFTTQLIELLPPTDPWRKFYQSEISFVKGDRSVAAVMAEELVDSLDYTNPVTARAASLLADYYSALNNRQDEAFIYRIVSAISDIHNCTREETSLNKVGIELYNRGETSLAYRCLISSLNNAIACGAHLRQYEVAEAVPMIVTANKIRDQHKVNIMTWMMVALLVALALIVGAVIMLRREMHSLAQMKQRLNEANRLKETFISQFLSLCSIYMEKLDEFNRMAARKIKAGQVEELYDYVRSGKMADEQNVLFCKIFDDAFTHIYPTFIEEVNALLQPDKRFHLHDGELLNTELRILAFLRLGMADSGQIARFLSLSLNTIYTYRNKIKGRALNRDTFEQSVMRIAQIG